MWEPGEINRKLLVAGFHCTSGGPTLCYYQKGNVYIEMHLVNGKVNELIRYSIMLDHNGKGWTKHLASEKVNITPSQI